MLISRRRGDVCLREIVNLNDREGGATTAGRRTSKLMQVYTGVHRTLRYAWEKKKQQRSMWMYETATVRVSSRDVRTWLL